MEVDGCRRLLREPDCVTIRLGLMRDMTRWLYGARLGEDEDMPVEDQSIL